MVFILIISKLILRVFSNSSSNKSQHQIYPLQILGIKILQAQFLIFKTFLIIKDWSFSSASFNSFTFNVYRKNYLPKMLGVAAIGIPETSSEVNNTN